MTTSMTTSLNHKPNLPIVLEDILISHINGHCLDKPCAAQVVLHLSPTLRTILESENFPIGILDHRLEMPFVISVKDKGDVQVSRLSLRVPDSTNRTARGALALYKSPFTVIRPDTEINSISFSVLNFLEFYGGNDKWIGSQLLGATTLKHDKLQIQLTQDWSYLSLVDTYN